VTHILKAISICFIILTSNQVDAQCPETNPNFLRTKNWYFGRGVGLSFEKDSVSVKNGYQGFNYEGTAILNDINGNLKYYSDGKYLYDSSHQIVNTNFMLKGDNSSCQSTILMESPNNPHLINILTTTPSYSVTRSGYRYSLYDEVLDSFLIANKILIRDVGEKQASTYHQNNRYSWLVVHSLLENTFYSFLTNEKTLFCCPLIKSIGQKYTDRFPSQGTLKFSPEGGLAINANWNLENFELLSFNKELGYFSNTTLVPLFYPYSTEFSRDGINIIVVDRGESIFHFKTLNIQDGVLTPYDTIVQNYPNEIFGQVQLSISGEICLSRYEDSLLSALTLVNDSIIFIDSAISLKGKKSLGGLPNFNASYFYTPSIDFAYTEDCWGHSYNFEGRDTLNATSWKWIFEKGSVSDSLFTKHCKYTFPDTGKWVVSHIASTATRSDTVTKTLTIRPQWQQDALGKDTFYCTDDSINLTLQAPIDMHCVHWNDEEPNLDKSLGPIVDYDHFHIDTLLVDTAGTYIVKLTNKTFCQMWDTIVIREEARPSKGVISRSGQELVSSIVAAEYRWYFNGSLKNTTTDSKLTPDSNGYYQVQLVSEFGCDSELSDSFNVGFAGIDKRYETLDLRFEIYPNPSDGNITIAVPKGGDYQVLIYDMTGKLIFNTSQSLSLLFELELELVSGTYLLTLTDDNGHKGSQKIEIIK
jgi:PKD repeat protein